MIESEKKYTPEAQLDRNFEDDALIKEEQLALVTQTSVRTWQRRRLTGDGPPYVKLGYHCVRYRWGDVRLWLATSTRRSTSEISSSEGAK